MTTEEDFHAALEANPKAHHTRLVFADFLQDHDDPRAEGYRALTIYGHPTLPQPEDTLKLFTYFNGHTESVAGETRLPGDWFALISGGECLHESSRTARHRDEPHLPWLDFPSRREAEDAAALAFAKLPAERLAELLAGDNEVTTK